MAGPAVSRVAIKFLGTAIILIALLHNELQTNMSTSSTFLLRITHRAIVPTTLQGQRVMCNTAPGEAPNQIAARNIDPMSVSYVEVRS